MSKRGGCGCLKLALMAEKVWNERLVACFPVSHCIFVLTERTVAAGLDAVAPIYYEASVD